MSRGKKQKAKTKAKAEEAKGRAKAALTRMCDAQWRSATVL